MSFGFGFGPPRAPLRGRPLVAAIRSLFAANEPGVWYDPSDFSTLYQDTAGTVPVTAVEQPVGLMLDKSKGLTLGPELVTNGDFSNGTVGWTENSGSITVDSGQLKLTAEGGAFGRAVQQINCQTGKSYKAVCHARVVSGSGNSAFRVTTSSDGSTAGEIRLATTTSATLVKLEFIFTATAPTLYLALIGSPGGSIDVRFDNISVREIPGNHATQPTATSRPVLSARYNLLTKTERFDDAVWSKFRGSVTANAGDSPLGTSAADLFTENMDSGAHMVRLVNVNLASSAYRLSLYVKASGRSRVAIGLETSTFTTFGAIFDLSSESVVANYGNATAGSSIEGVGNGWMLVTIENTQQIKDVGIVLVESGTTTSYTGDGTSGIYIWGADIRVANAGTNLPPYQRVNTATDYDTQGFPHYLYFDGVDDWLVTNTITPGTDKAQVFAGVRKLSDGVRGALVESFSSALGATGGFGLSVSGPSDGATYRVFSGGSTITGTDASGFVAPITNVLTGIGDISGDSAILRVNGTQAAQSTLDQGTGNYLDYPLHIGRRGGTTLQLHGHLYSLIVRFGSNLPIETIEKIEKYVNSRTRAY